MCVSVWPQDKAWLAQTMSSHKKHVQEAEAQGFWRLLLDAASNRKVWITGCAALLKNAAMVGILFWAPIIVHAMLKGGQVDFGATASVSTAVGGHGHRHLMSSFTSVVVEPAGQQHPQFLLQQQTRSLLGAAAAVLPASGSPAVGVATTPAAGAGGASSGERGVAAVLLTAIPFICASGCAVWLGHRSQQRREKCKHVAVPYALAAVLFLIFPSIASIGGTLAFLCLTAAITSLTAPNAILNTIASAVSAGPSSAISLALYNAIGNLGGLVGPWLIGRVVQATGLYASALQLLGVMVALAGGLAWHMRGWNV